MIIFKILLKDNFNISFNDNNNRTFGEGESLKAKDEKEENEADDSDLEKNHINIMNEFTSKLNLAQNSLNLSFKLLNKQNSGKRNISQIEGYNQFINYVGKMEENNPINNSAKKKNIGNYSLPNLLVNSNLKKKDIKNIEMKNLDNVEDNKDNNDKKEN